MFHLASIDIMDDWDRDAKEQVGAWDCMGLHMHVRAALGTLFIIQN